PTPHPLSGWGPDWRMGTTVSRRCAGSVAVLSRSAGRVGGVEAAQVLLFLRAEHVYDRVDQRQMGERLREVAQVPAGVRVDLLGVEVQRAGEGQQPLAEPPGPRQLADLDERGHQPERADRERTLLAGQPVVARVGDITQYEPVAGQLV